MDEQTRLKARELLLRSRIYRFIALVFGVIGLGVFLFLYFKHVSGDFFHAVKSPATVLILVVPFLPAFVVSWMAVRAEKKLKSLLQAFQELAADKAVSEKKSKSPKT